MAGDMTSPLFTAVSSSARQLYVLLRCINNSSKAQVQISEQGLRVSVEESSVMEGMAFLEKSLFTSFVFKPSHPSSFNGGNQEHDDEDSQSSIPAFSISLPALLETLQIFSATDPARGYSYSSRDSAFPHANAFSNSILGISSLCRLTYHSPGSPLQVILSENNVTTTSDLVTYEPSITADIPFDRQSIVLKVIMRGNHLHDAISELGASGPSKLVLSASSKNQTFTLAAASDLGSALVEFSRDAGTHYTPATDNNNNPDNDPSASALPAAMTGLLETFQVSGSFAQSYKFAHVAQAKRAMAAATKVSLRADEQGVLSMQFMVENLEQTAMGGGSVGAANVSFIDFRFVPMLRDPDDPDDVYVEGAEEDDD